MAHARLGKWAEARELFKGVDFAIGALPLELQRIAIVDALRASLEVRDYAGVSSRFNELEIVGIAPDQEGYLALLRGRMAQALGREKDALSDYRAAIASPDRASASEAKLYEVELALKRGEMTSERAQADLETLSVTWRGDAIEVKTLQLLARIYDKEDRFRDALMAARMATRLQPNSDVSRQMQDEAADAVLDSCSTGARSDDMPAVQALALFYEFRELTPIGRRGDEMIRRLADRLAAVDLLDQAGELLQYQVEHRLDGSARAHVASRLAMIYLTNRKPDRALAALRGDAHRRSRRRIAAAAAAARSARAERRRPPRSRARHHLQSGRPRGDPAALRHPLGGAALARVVGADRAALRRALEGLRAAERAGEVRHHSRRDRLFAVRRRHRAVAAEGEVCGEADGDADRAAFEAATRLAATNSAEFATIARMAASVDTLDGFLREMRHRFPEMASRTPLPQAAANEQGRSDDRPARCRRSRD